MKKVFLFIINWTLLLSFEQVLASKIRGAIDNPDIGINVEKRDPTTKAIIISKPTVKYNGANYKSGDRLIEKNDGSFYLERRNLAARESRLNVAHQQPNGKMRIATYHLVNSEVHRATQCQQVDLPGISIGSDYQCFYSSRDTCRHLNSKLKKYASSLKDCQSINKEILEILPFSSKNYDYFTQREAHETEVFLNSNHIEITADSYKAITLDATKAQQVSSLALYNNLFESVRLCNDFFPEVMDSKLVDAATKPSSKSSTTQ